MVYFLQAKPNKTYYQMDTSSFDQGEISRLETPFLVKIPEKAFFLLKNQCKICTTIHQLLVFSACFSCRHFRKRFNIKG